MKSIIRTIGPYLLAFGCGHHSVPSSSKGDVDPAAHNSIRMGQGFNSIGGAAYSEDLSYCVERTPTTTLGQSSGADLTIYVDSVSSQQEVDLAVSSSQRFGAGGSQSNLFSASADYKDNRKINSTYLSKYSYVFIRIKEAFAPEVMSEFRVSQESLTYFTAKPSEFFGKCGDRFVSGVQKGAEVIAFLRCEVDSQTQKEEIDRSVKAQAGYKGLTASGSVDNIIDSVRNSTNNKCVVVVAAQGGVGSYDVNSSESLVSSAIGYVTRSTPATASPLEFQTMPYSSILNLDFANSVINKVDLALANQKSFIAEKKSEIHDAMSIIADADYDPVRNQPMISYGLATIDKLASSIDVCLRDIYSPTKCRDPATTILPPGAVFRPGLDKR